MYMSQNNLLKILNTKNIICLSNNEITTNEDLYLYNNVCIEITYNKHKYYVYIDYDNKTKNISNGVQVNNFDNKNFYTRNIVSLNMLLVEKINKILVDNVFYYNIINNEEIERNMRLDYINNFLTIEKFSEYYNIPINRAKQIVNKK